VINEINKQSEAKMKKSLESLEHAFARIRTGRASPSLLESVMISYYGTDTPITQVANVVVEDARTLMISPWEKPLIPQIEKAILKSDLGLNPSTSGDVIRLPMPPLTEETRRDLVKHARGEAENARIAIRNLRRDANGEVKALLKDKEISEDEERKALDAIQKLTDRYIALVDKTLADKEQDLMAV
jgi:ribosome recycling factor